jgi:hypothetical protein
VELHIGGPYWVWYSYLIMCNATHWLQQDITYLLPCTGGNNNCHQNICSLFSMPASGYDGVFVTLVRVFLNGDIEL